eukprot:105702_1
MQDLIRLQQGIDTLSDNEFLKLIETFGKHKFGLILFKYFHDKLQRIEKYQDIDNGLSTVNTINNMIADIVTCRESDSSTTHYQISKQKRLKLDELPSAIISHISSFINFTNILNFEKCNRSIFVA